VTDQNKEQFYLKTEFLERIAHELRGPAGVTLGALDEIDLALSDGNNSIEHLRPLFTMARRGVYRILRTSERLQRTAQLEKGTLDESRMPVDIKGLVSMAMDATKLVEARSNISVNFKPPALPFLVFVNSPLLVIAIAELILNAIRNADKKVTIEIKKTVENSVELWIIDDGNGFSGPWNRRFTTQSRRQGLGLSLSLVDDVIRAHDGNFFVEPAIHSNPPGARMRISLPLVMQ